MNPGNDRLLSLDDRVGVPTQSGNRGSRKSPTELDALASTAEAALA